MDGSCPRAGSDSGPPAFARLPRAVVLDVLGALIALLVGCLTGVATRR